ncbi:MAG: TIM barrel protein [Alteromonadaceae bacterium]|nr:TIM barrel protein [Alteromonadaceae bacterium]
MNNRPKLSVQLWSVKDVINTDFKNTLKKLSAMGFEGVEFANEFGPFVNDAKGLKAFLDSINLSASGAHVSFEQLNEHNFQQTIEFYQQLGVDTLIVGWDERAWHPEGIIEVVKLLNEIDKKITPFNIKTGFHNHNYEFNKFQDSTYWDYLATHTAESVVLQQDVGWTTYAGKDPIEYVKKYPNRTLTTHYKVRLPEGVKNKQPFIGLDTIDWLNLLKANISVGGTKWIVVEQEEYPNGLTSLEAVALSKKGPAVKFPPPLVFVIFILIGYALQDVKLFNITINPEMKSVTTAIGIITFLAGFAIIAISIFAFKRAKTHIEPWQPTSAIISTGLFAYSRNPIYLAFCLITIGVGIFLNNGWITLSFIPSAFIIFHIAIKKEELYLAEKFGEEYLQYKGKVRRWL